MSDERDKADEDLNIPGWCWALTVAVVAAIFGTSIWAMSGPIDPLDSRVVNFDRDEVLRTVVWAGRAGTPVRGPNGKDTDWAVFFYKPYCGACKRVWPAFRALGATTNSSGKLRFGEVDCVRNQHVCAMMGAEKHPMIRLYKAKTGTTTNTKAPSPKAAATGFKREVAAEWQGLLIAYEVVNWFISLQQGGEKLIDASVKWPDDDELGDAMRRFRARGKTQVETSMTRRPADPAGYLVDARLALDQGLIDHVFPTSAPLQGARLEALARWLALQEETFPQKAVRAQVRALRERLVERSSWDYGAYKVALTAAGFATAPPQDSAWRWCAPSAGRGGYTCGLWVLFHTTLANCPRTIAPLALDGIARWVADFFGCAECASHFAQYYASHGGGEQGGHGQIGAVNWLWRAHNDVSMRLRAEELRNDGASVKAVWPHSEDCKECFNATERGGGGGWGSEREGQAGEWQPHSVFEYHQEIYCFESDTYVCSGFDDPSKETKSRARARDEAGDGVSAKAGKAGPAV